MPHLLLTCDVAPPIDFSQRRGNSLAADLNKHAVKNAMRMAEH